MNLHLLDKEEQIKSLQSDPSKKLFSYYDIENELREKNGQIHLKLQILLDTSLILVIIFYFLVTHLIIYLTATVFF